MPLARITDINDSVSYALWHIDESLEELIPLYPFSAADREILDANKVAARKMEWLSARLALKALLKRKGLADLSIYKDEYGKPHLQDSSVQISISHTSGYGAAIINLAGPAGIDIEFPRPQVQRIARKFLHQDEGAWAGENMELLTQIWSAKEALYKLHGRTQLIFASQLYVHEPTGSFPEKGEIIENEERDAHQLFFEVNEGLITCLAY